jgi:hypothetical protein
MAAYEEQFPLSMSERPLRFDSRETNPAVLVRGQLRRLMAAHREEVDRVLVVLAQVQFQVRALGQDLAARGESPHATDAMEIIAANLQEVLDGYGVRADDFAGRPWSPELRAETDVRGYRVCEDLTVPRVIHVELPAVWRQDRLLAKGAVLLAGPKQGT